MSSRTPVILRDFEQEADKHSSEQVNRIAACRRFCGQTDLAGELFLAMEIA
ncbi:MAG: hypothetical protein ABFE01_20820 [Phycisphaerales bacterium]|jgi:hypothetical protein